MNSQKKFDSAIGQSFQGVHVLVIGLGKSGVAAANLLVKRGAHVFVSESQKRSLVEDSLKKLSPKVIVEVGAQKFLSRGYDLVVVSPGVPWSHPRLVAFRKKGIPVWPEVELGARFIEPKKIIAITGTNGKTTTTALIGHILKSAGYPTVVGGNIGTPLCDLVEKIDSKSFVVLELSSYQLEAIDQFHAHVGVVLNLTPDHLARHKTMAGYSKAKAKIFKNSISSDTAIYNRSDSFCRKMVAHTKAKKIPFPSPTLSSMAKSLSLPGQHNQENAMAAAAAALAVGVPSAKIKKALATFEAVPHRIQPVATVKGVLYVNDSKATNVDSTLVALRSFNRPIRLILGGEHKGSSYTPLIPLIKKHVVEILTIGEAAPLIEKDLGKVVTTTACHNLKGAIQYAHRVSRKNDVVLLSPACASFDQFKNFEHRGTVFMELVKTL